MVGRDGTSGAESLAQTAYLQVVRLFNGSGSNNAVQCKACIGRHRDLLSH